MKKILKPTTFFLSCVLGIAAMYGCNAKIEMEDKRIRPEDVREAFAQRDNAIMQLAKAVKELQDKDKSDEPEVITKPKKEIKK